MAIFGYDLLSVWRNINKLDIYFQRHNLETIDVKLEQRKVNNLVEQVGKVIF